MIKFYRWFMCRIWSAVYYEAWIKAGHACSQDWDSDENYILFLGSHHD